MFYLILGFIHIENKVSCYCRIVATDSFKNFKQVSSVPMCKPRLLFFFFLKGKNPLLITTNKHICKNFKQSCLPEYENFLSRNNWNTSAQLFSPSEIPMPHKQETGTVWWQLWSSLTGRADAALPAPPPAQGKGWSYSVLFCQVSPERHQRTNREQNGSPEGNKKVQIKTMVLSSTVAKATWGLVIIWN